MKVALLLFTYKRGYHTEQVIRALKRNTVLPSKLIVFQDGKKGEEDSGEWEKVNALIHAIDWCDKEVIVSEHNKGLADSIVSGINYAFKKYDAVVVLEDDCVPTANFTRFMFQCLERYQNNKNVYSINGYSYPVALEKKQYDVYGCGVVWTWGWGTWKDRWSVYTKDYELIKKMKQGEESSRNLAMWGSDLENMLIGNVKGSNDSWAVFWALNIIARKGICIHPYESFIRNIGMDGTGVHCGVTKQYEVKCIDEEKKEFCLPDQIDFSKEAAHAYISLCGSYTALNQKDESRENILIYGLGNFYLKNEKVISERYNIMAFVDGYKHGWFAGKKIISVDEIEQYTYDRILIMIINPEDCRKIVRKIVDRGISSDKILLGCNFFGKWDIVYTA